LTHEGWVEAGSLTLGDQILSLDGTFGDVENISISNDPQVMYNLTVDISHTFAVGEGQWVVHNTVQCGDTGTYGDLSARSDPNDGLQNHHIPRASSLHEYGLNRNNGMAITLTDSDHQLTLSYRRPHVPGVPFNDRLYADIVNLRDIATSVYGKPDLFDEGIREIVQNYVGRDLTGISDVIDLDDRFTEFLEPK
jgi:hypothetical protein